MEQTPEVQLTRYENFPKVLKVIFSALIILGIGIVIFNIFGFSIRGTVMLAAGYYYLLIAFFLPCAFLILPAHKKAKGVPWYDLLAASFIFGIAFYFFLNAWSIGIVGWSHPTPLNAVLGVILGIAVLESARRVAGPVYFAIVMAIALFPLFADHMPGLLYGIGFSPIDTVGEHIFGSSGLIGIPTQVMGHILIGFLIFAGILVASGAGKFFLNLASAVLGRFRGGPAKIAVIGSGFFGSLSGSTFSNIVATGSMTIPAMKRLGYPARYAAAIEACASTGGMFMPPVMGAVAFVMAAFLGIEYRAVIVAAALPAILYYFGLLMQVDAYAAKVKLKGLARAEIPSLKETFKEGWPFIAVFLFLLWGLLYMRWEAMASFYASGFMLLLACGRRETRLSAKRIGEIVALVGKLISQTMALLLPIGFIISGLHITGTSPAFTAAIVDLGMGNVFLTLLLGTMVCYLLGMAGLVVAAYIVLAISLAPALLAIADLNVLAIHLFIIYYAMVSGITPPVAPNSFLAATLAGAKPMQTALLTMRLGIVIYFIPFFFIFNPSLILEGPFLETLYLFPLCLLGIALISAGAEGYLLKVGNIGWLVRSLLMVAGFLIAFPEWKTSIIGAALALFVIATILIRRIKRKVRAYMKEQSETYQKL